MKLVIILIILVILVIGGTFFFLNQGPQKEISSKTESKTDVEIGVVQRDTEIPSKTAEGEVHKVQIENFKLPTLEINVGDSVEWTNLDTTPHTATADNKFFDTDRLENGDSHKVTFNKPGVYSYFCDIHPSMKGTVTVK